MLTVLISTRNRASILSAVLEHYGKVEEPSGGWNLLVVDNGSTDQTRDVVRRSQRRLPLTYLFEPTIGKNVALNMGLVKITGDLVVFTDDDVFPKQDWLVRMRDAADAHADYAIFAGSVIPRWETQPDPWILSSVPLGVVFTISDARLSEGPTSAHNVFGPNMAVRAEVFANGHRFDPQIGPRGASYAMGSEAEFVRRLIRGGLAAWYCREAVVEHFIPASHLQMPWILSRALRFGRGLHRITRHDQEQMPSSWFGVPRYLFRELMVSKLHCAVASLTRDRDKVFQAQWQANYIWGQIVEAWLMRAANSPVSGLQTPFLN